MLCMLATYLENTSAGLERELKLTTSTFKEAESTLLRKRKDLRTKEHELQQSGVSINSEAFLSTV